MINWIRAKYRAWQLRRLWTPEVQLDYLKRQLEEDARWLAHDPKCAALCKRYRGMLADDWYRRPIQRVDVFRRQLGCDPHAANKEAL